MINSVNKIDFRVEKDAQGNQAAVLAFYPEFQYEEVSDNEFISHFPLLLLPLSIFDFKRIFLVDLSNSMQEKLDDLKRTVEACLLRLPDGCRFNIITFGTYYEVSNK